MHNNYYEKALIPLGETKPNTGELGNILHEISEWE
jgi:hypothetical protein